MPDRGIDADTAVFKLNSFEKYLYSELVIMYNTCEEKGPRAARSGKVIIMAERNRVKLTICGMDYIVTTGDDVKYIQTLGEELDKRMTTLMDENARISVTQAAVLAALEYADAAKKADSSADNLRSQIQDYLEDAARAKTNAEVYRQQADRLGKELAALRSEKKGN